MSENKSRVRFAPSPTGTLHIGGARTALYNWLFACQSDGDFILRIEDTDVSRSTEQALETIINGLRWLGLEWSEGPGAESLKYGPYRQTQRLNIYNKYTDKLLKEGRAYYCYCTPEELQAQRDAARLRKIAPHYSKKCKHLTHDELVQFQNEGRKPSIRYAVPDSGATVFDDLVRGPVSFENKNINDFILVRQSGIPTYNLVVAVDDSEMDITHVIRGDDHLSNTPKQIMLLKDFEKPAPRYGHLPLILGPDKQPLSKRHGATSVEEFRSLGYLPEALNNYLALLGWSFDDKTTFFSTRELIEKFGLNRVSKSPAIIDFTKLEWMNGHYIRQMPVSELASKLKDYLEYKGLAGTYLGDGKIPLEKSVAIVQDKIKTLWGFHGLNNFLYVPRELNEDAVEKLKAITDVKTILEKAKSTLEAAEPFDTETIEVKLKELVGELGAKPKHFFQAVRIAISGKTVTGGLFESLELLGKEKSIEYISETITSL